MNRNEARLMVLKALRQAEIIGEQDFEEMSAAPDSHIELAALNIDSMKVIDLCNCLEETLGREVQIEELVENPSVNALAGHFAEKAA